MAIDFVPCRCQVALRGTDRLFGHDTAGKLRLARQAGPTMPFYASKKIEFDSIQGINNCCSCNFETTNS